MQMAAMSVLGRREEGKKRGLEVGGRPHGERERDTIPKAKIDLSINLGSVSLPTRHLLITKETVVIFQWLTK